MRKLAQLDAAWLTVFLCYCTVFGGILVYSDSLAYTIGNNESVSTFRHARHMYEHGIANSSGLRDESFSQDAAAQPYLYISFLGRAHGCLHMCCMRWASGR